MKVIVLMSTYNGEKYIREQLDSILAQKGVDVSIFVRDDGSKDATHDILDEYQEAGKLVWYTGKNLRSAKSFMDLVYTAKEADYYAFCDQDDYWLPEKLKVAVEHLEIFEKTKPALYYSRYKMVDQDLNPLPDSADTPYISLTMKQAVVNSNCTGCTVVFNKCLLDYMKSNKAEFQIMHDNWIHKVCVALDGNVYFDKHAYILYRQHGNNVIGGSTSMRKRLKRHIDTALRTPCYRSDSIATLYDEYREYMPDENRKVCALIKDYKKGFNRFKIIFDKNYKTGNRSVDILFKLDVLLGVF